MTVVKEAKETKETKETKEEIEATLSAEVLRYSEVWEDEEQLRAGLRIGPGDRVLSIASAGSNVFSMLLDDPEEVVAIDLNRAQLALVALKIEAYRRLEWREFFELFGLGTSGEKPGISGEESDAAELVERLMPGLPEEARAYLEAHPEIFNQRISGAGRLDRYFEGFRETVLPEYFGEEAVEALFGAKSLEAQRAVFRGHVSEEFEEAFRAYFGRASMARRGRSEAQFKHVEVVDVGEAFLERFEDVCTRGRVAENYYLHRFLTGRYRSEEAVPHYLREENFGVIRDRVGRIRLVRGELGAHLEEAEGYYDKANLSDVFEYHSPQESDAYFRLLAGAMRPGGRVAYWCLLNARGPGEAVKGFREVGPEEYGAREDRAWFYRSFHVLEREKLAESGKLGAKK